MFEQSIPDDPMLSSILAWRFKHVRILDSSLSESPPIAGDALDNILCKLPIDVARKILSDYSTIVDIVRLDSAALVHDHRMQFKLRYKGITVQHGECIQVNLSSVQWLSSRAVYVRSVKIDCAMVVQWQSQNSSHPIMREVSKVLIEWRVNSERSYELQGNNKVRVIWKDCPKLQHLCISQCTLDTNVLQDVMSMCPLLTEVHLTWSSVRTGIIEPLLSPRMVSLDLTGCHGINDAAVAAITTSCTGLRTLVLDYCDNYSRNSVDSIARNCPRLEVLGLRSLRDLHDASVAALAASCTNLRELHFEYNTTLTSEGILSIAACCTKLTKFTLLHCEQVRADAVVALVSSCPNLHTVAIPTDSTVIVALSKTCPRLTKVDLSWPLSNARVKGDVFTQLLRQCPALRELSVQSFSGCPPCDDPFISSVEKLCLSWSTCSTDYYTSGIFTCLPNLREVHLLHFELIGDQTVFRIAARCPLLQLVELVCLDNLTDASIIALSRACPLLSNVCINDCPQLTDRAVVSIAQHCPLLTHLSMCNHYADDSMVGTAMALLRGYYLGDTSIAALAEHSKHLRELDIRYNPRISKAALRALSAALPRCKVKRKDL